MNHTLLSSSIAIWKYVNSSIYSTLRTITSHTHNLCCLHHPDNAHHFPVHRSYLLQEGAKDDRPGYAILHIKLVRGKGWEKG